MFQFLATLKIPGGPIIEAHYSWGKESRKEDMNTIKALFFVRFRFQPMDEELVSYFLFRKINGHSIIQDGKVKDIDIYQHEPMKLYDMYGFNVLCVSSVSIYINICIRFILGIIFELCSQK